MTLSEEEWCRSNCFAFTLRDLYGGWGKRVFFFFYTKYSFVIQVYVIHCQQYFSYISWLPVFIGWKKFKNFWEIQLSKCWPMKGQKTQLCSTCNSSPTWSIILICKCQFLSPSPPPPPMITYLFKWKSPDDIRADQENVMLKSVIIIRQLTSDQYFNLCAWLISFNTFFNLTSNLELKIKKMSGIQHSATNKWLKNHYYTAIQFVFRFLNDIFI